MSIRFVLVAAVLYFLWSTGTHAQPLEIQPVEHHGSLEPEEDGEIDWDQPENIIRKQSLAVHLGLTPADVIFGVPRTFRSEPLNTFQLEPLFEAEEP